VRTLRQEGDYDKKDGDSVMFATDVSSMQLLYLFSKLCSVHMLVAIGLSQNCQFEK